MSDDQDERRRQRRIARAACNLTALLYPLNGALCRVCHNNKATDRHHVNGNVLDMRPENVALLCNPCHRALHKAARRKTTEPRLCISCGRVMPDRNRPRCEACRAYYRRTGQERGLTGREFGLGTPRKRVNAELVQAIRQDREDGATYKALAARYGLSITTIGQIVRRETWTDSGPGTQK